MVADRVTDTVLMSPLFTVHFRVSQHQKGKLVQEVKSYIAMFLEEYHQANLGVRMVLIFDFTDAGIMNMV